MMNNKNILGKILKQFSIDTGVSQKDIAGKLGFSNQRVNNYFRGLADPPHNFFVDFRKEYGIDLKKLIDKESKGVTEKGPASYNPLPVYDLELKTVNDPAFFNYSELISYYIDAPMFNDCFAGVRVTGEAMAPAFGASDVILIKRVEDFDAIPLGEPFMIVTKEQRLIRYIRAHGKQPSLSWLLKAEDERLDDIIIKRAAVKHLFQIKGKIARR